MDATHLSAVVVGLVVGLLIGAFLATRAARSRQAPELAAARTEASLLRDRVDDLDARRSDEASQSAALTPLAESLRRVERQVGLLERDRVEQFGELGERLAQVSASTSALREQTASLVGSLNSSSVRGTWGETQLRRVLEVAGLMARCDFDEQVGALSRHGVRVRPDVVVRLPGDRALVIDAKAPMSAFLAAQGDGLDAIGREARLAEHAATLRGHVLGLAAKEYWTAFATTPEMVICFVPADAILAAALASDPSLFDEALRRRVVLVSPSTLLALLRTVAFTWQQDALTDNARELLTLGRDLYARLGTLGGHVDKMGAQLRRSVESYNSLVGTLESRVLVTARRMHELDLADRPGPAISPIDVAPRPLTTVELLDALTPVRGPDLLDLEDPPEPAPRGAVDRSVRRGA